MSNTFSKSSAYIDSLVNFTLDTKPYHSKLTEVAVEYRFEDSINVKVEDAISSKMQTKAGWLYDYFSGGSSTNRVLQLQRLVSPDVLRQELNLDEVNNPGGFKVARDENMDMVTVPYVYDKRWSLGIADAWIDRSGGPAKDFIVEGHDYFRVQGAMSLQVSAASPTDTDQSRRWQELNAQDTISEVTLATRAAALDITNPESANRRIRAILEQIEAWLLIYPSVAASTELAALYAIIDTPDLPQSYEALLNILQQSTPVMPGYTGWIGEDGTPSPGDKYVDDALSQNTPSAFFYAFSDLRLREGGKLVFDEASMDGVRIYNIQQPAGIDADEWTFIVNSISPTVVFIYGQSAGFIGSVTIGNSFSSYKLSFDSAIAAGTATVGDSRTVTPKSRLTISDSAPLEFWNIIKVNPIGYSRPAFISTRYGYVRDLSNTVGSVTILDSSIPSGTVVLTAVNSTTFTLSSTAEPGYTGTVTVGTLFNDGRLGFTLVAGSAQSFVAGDKFFIQIVNPEAKVVDLDLHYGYDLDSYDDQTTVYDNQNPVDPNYLKALAFNYGSRFTDYDVDQMNMVVQQNAVAGRQFKLMAIPDTGSPIAIMQKDGSGITNIIDLQATTSGVPPDVPANAPPLVSMAGDPNPDPDLYVYNVAAFRLEYSDDGFQTTTYVGDVPVGSTFVDAGLGISFDLVEGSKPFIAVSSDDGASRVEGGDVFLFTISNEDPYVDPLPVIASSLYRPRLVMHGDGFRDAPAADWTLTFTSSSVYAFTGVYTSGPNIGNVVTGYPVTGSLGVTGTGVIRNLSYKDANVHFTVVRGNRNFVAGDQFTFSTYDSKPSILVHGSVSGWQPDAEVGKWYWNGKIGFKIEEPLGVLCKNGTPIDSGDVDYGSISIVNVGFDAPEVVYSFKRVDDGLTVTYSVSRDDVGTISYVPTTGTFKDRYIEVALSNPSEDFELRIETDDFKFWNARSTMLVRPDIDALYPETTDYLSFKKAHDSKLAISLRYDQVASPPDLTALSPTAVDINLIDISTGAGNTPIEAYSPEAVVFDGWIPLQQTGYDATNSIAHFSDTATEIRLKSASSGEAVGRVYSVGALNEPILFEWDENFFNRYLPLNAQATLVTYGTFMDEKVNVHITERVNFLTSGGVLLEDALFNDAVNVTIGEEHTIDISAAYNEDVNAIVLDGPFEGFLPGYANLPFDAETVTLVDSLLESLSQQNLLLLQQMEADIVTAGLQHPTSGSLTEQQLLDRAAITAPYYAQIEANNDATYAAILVQLDSAGGQFDTGNPLVDSYLQAVYLAQLPTPSPTQIQQLQILTSLIQDYLQPGGVLSTSLVQFLQALDADPYVVTSNIATLGLPKVGVAFDVNKSDSNTAAAAVQEAITFYSFENDILFDEEGFDLGELDAFGDKTVIMQTDASAPIPNPTPVLPPLPGAVTYANLDTPLEVAIPARVFEIYFTNAPAVTPTFTLWISGDPEPTTITIVEQISPKRFSFSISAASEAKVVVT